MWNEPYLESCCRAALHRLVLAAASGRPDAPPDAPCLDRLAGMGFCARASAGRYVITAPGAARHATEVLKRAS